MACIDELPQAAQQYLAFIAEKTGVEIGSVSNGPERNETMIVAGSKLEQLLQGTKMRANAARPEQR